MLICRNVEVWRCRYVKPHKCRDVEQKIYRFIGTKGTGDSFAAQKLLLTFVSIWTTIKCYKREENNLALRADVLISNLGMLH